MVMLYLWLWSCKSVLPEATQRCTDSRTCYQRRKWIEYRHAEKVTETETSIEEASGLSIPIEGHSCSWATSFKIDSIDTLHPSHYNSEKGARPSLGKWPWPHGPVRVQGMRCRMQDLNNFQCCKWMFLNFFTFQVGGGGGYKAFVSLPCGQRVAAAQVWQLGGEVT